MRVLLGSCVWGGACARLRAAGHDDVWAGDWEEDPGDEGILARAYAENRIVVTLDKDFGELAIVQGRRHRGIVRVVNFSAEQQATICLSVLARYAAELMKGAIVTAERNRVRVRPSRP